MGARAEPRVQAVVVNLDGGDYIEEALESLRQQDWQNLRTTVVDNGSHDGSIDRIKAGFPEVSVIENGCNLGFGGANNVGMRMAVDDGDSFVFLLNYDASAPPSCVRLLVERAASSGAGMVGPKILYHHDPRLIWSAGGTVQWWRGNVVHRGIRQKDRGQFDTCVDVDYLTACAVLLDTSMLRRVGLFDDAYFPSYFEDTDLCQRALLAGYRLVYEPEAVAWHRVSSHSGGGTTPLKVTLRLRNQLFFFRRYARWYHWATIPPCAGVTAVGLAVRWLLEGRWQLIRAMIRGLRAAVRARPREYSGE